MNKMNITAAQYVDTISGVNSEVKATIDGAEMTIPIDLKNRHYAGIVAATVKDGSFWGVTVPEQMATEAATWLFDKQLAEYGSAVVRLAQYIVSVGRAEVIVEGIVTVGAVEPVEATVTRIVYSDDIDAEPTEETIENPLITVDVAERAAAQAVIDSTPQEVREYEPS